MQNTPIMYSTHCPMCKGLERILNVLGINYTICTDITIMKELGITRVPVLSVNGELLSYKQAIDWARSQEQ